MKNRNAYGRTLIWGAVLGIGLILFELVKMFARRVDYVNVQVFDIALIIGFILVLHAGVKDFKAHYTERLSFAKAFLCCSIISLIGCVLMFAYGMLHFSVIEKDGLQKKYETALNNFHKNIEKDTITTDELKTYLLSVDSLIPVAEAKLPESLPDSLRKETVRGVEMIDRYYAEKLSACQKTDTADHYRMSNFTAYSRKNLVETLESYVAQNENQPSTQWVQMAVQELNNMLPTIDPVEVRFEKNKSHVPHYDKPGTYVAVASAMDLLYGMFFGIFVAIFNYTSKRPLNVVTEPAEGEDVERTSEEENNPNDELKNC